MGDAVRASGLDAIQRRSLLRTRATWRLGWTILTTLAVHTVEGGFVKTAPLHLGSNVTIGLGSVIEIGVQAGDGCQVGALSFVPKHCRLETGAIYAGIRAERIR